MPCHAATGRATWVDRRSHGSVPGKMRFRAVYSCASLVVVRVPWTVPVQVAPPPGRAMVVTFHEPLAIVSLDQDPDLDHLTGVSDRTVARIGEHGSSFVRNIAATAGPLRSRRLAMATSARARDWRRLSRAILLLAIVPAPPRGHVRDLLARVRSGALRSIEAIVVDVEVDVSSGLPHTARRPPDGW